jgi:putative heme-binding domain-containing protein
MLEAEAGKGVSTMYRWRSVGALVVAGMCAAGAGFAQPRYLPGEIEGGGRLYSANCTGCHGPEGDGVAAVNFSKGQFRRASSDDDIARIIVSGIPGTPMPPGNFSGSQAATIVAYLRSLAGSGGTTASGDAARGRLVFEGKGQCVSCHAVNGTGSRLGPSLTEIGSFRRIVELRTSLIEPDAEIRPENRSVRVVMRDGATMTGRLLNQDTFTLQLLDPQERLLLFEKANVREFDVLKTSPMPSYRDKLSAQELADLVGYLASLRGRP